MGEMVERVARAIHKSTRNWLGLECNWDTLISGSKDVHMDNARAAIEAMREPTDIMLSDGEFDELVWRKMIDAALK